MDQQGQSEDNGQLLSHVNQALLLAPPSSSSHIPANMVQAPGGTITGGSGGGSQFPMVNSYQLQQTQQQTHHPQNLQKREMEMRQRLRLFWENQIQEIKKIIDFKNHSLPLARIKKIMKADEDVKMISAEAPMIFAKACEMFILELTLRSWSNTEENKRRTLLRNDVTLAIATTDIFDFLVDIIPRDHEININNNNNINRSDLELQQQQQQPLIFSMQHPSRKTNIIMPAPTDNTTMANNSNHPQPYYNLSQHPVAATTEDVMFNSRMLMDPTAASLFRQHMVAAPPPYIAPVFWYPQEQQQQQDQEQEQEQEQHQPPSSTASDSRS